ncbi:MAG: adenylyltransferase/cytidyltransferase family protein [Chloroflexi bacterium]|nr:adenylyltransferase/cytidyltransferase family protein [Chloroflexota bacterium]
MTTVVVMGSFDDLRSRHIRFLEEAAKLGDLHVLLWDDAIVQAMTGNLPKFPQAERLYLLRAIRYVTSVGQIANLLYSPDALPPVEDLRPDVWVVDEVSDTAAKRAFCTAHGLEYRVLTADDLLGFPTLPTEPDGAPPNSSSVVRPSSRKRVVVTGCYDWFHSGHVRFFEEASALGDLYVVLGHDENVRLLKGEGHPMLPQDERRYVVQACRYVKQALLSTGHGWMDAEPEVERLKPDIYAVNEDGDKPEKRAFCRERGLEYVILKRMPKAGLPKRASSELRGF